MKLWVIAAIGAMTVSVLWASPPSAEKGDSLAAANLPAPPVEQQAAAVAQETVAETAAPAASEPSAEAPAAVAAPTVEAATQPAAEPTPEPNAENVAAEESAAAVPAPVVAPPVTSQAATGVADGMITHWPLQNAPIRLVLRQLAMMSQRNIIASKEVEGLVTADLYNVTFREALDAVLLVNGFDYMEKGNFIYVYTAKQIDDIRKRDRKLSVRVFTLHYTKPDDAKTLLTPCLSPDGSISVTPAAKAGIATSDVDTGGQDYAVNDVVVIRDYDENLDHIATILKDVDRRPQQVLIEATILSVDLKEENALGVNIQSLAGVSFSDLNSTTTGVQNVVPAPNTPVITPSNSINSTFPFNPTLTTGGLSVGFISDNISFFIKALEGVADTSVLANPKLLIVNKQRGEVHVGHHDGYLTQTSTETTTVQNVLFLDTGTSLIVRPYIGDNGYVRMEVHPEDSTGGVVAGLPQEQTTECTSNVLVKDGHTIIISGLFREVTSNSVSQIPVLGNIPYLGAAFRSKIDGTERQEVIILLTPRIIKEAPDAIASEQLRDDVERFRVGMRQNLSCYGRGQLAAAHLRWAKENMANGNTNCALWNLNMALNLSAGMPEAVELKERLTGEAIWAHEPRLSYVQNILQQMVMNDLGLDPLQVEYPNKPLDADQLPAEARKAMGIGNLPHGTLLEDFGPCPDGLVKTSVNSADSATDGADEASAAVDKAADVPAVAPATEPAQVPQK